MAWARIKMCRGGWWRSGWLGGKRDGGRLRKKGRGVDWLLLPHMRGMICARSTNWMASLITLTTGLEAARSFDGYSSSLRSELVHSSGLRKCFTERLESVLLRRVGFTLLLH